MKCRKIIKNVLVSIMCFSLFITNIETISVNAIGVWEKNISKMPTPRGHLTTQIYNDKIYSIGGRDETDIPTSKLEIYDLKTNTWSQGADMPTARYTMTSELYKGKIYVIGGSMESRECRYLEIYDIATDTWTTGESMVRGYDYMYMTSVVHNGKIYAIGKQVIQVYDINTNTWSVLTDVPTRRTGAESELYNGKIYTIGGYSSGVRVGTVDIYDIKTNTWSQGTDMPTGRDIFATEVYNGKIYAIGGYNSGALDKVEIYNIATDSWSDGPTMIEGRYQIETARYGRKIYAIGGEDSTKTKTGAVDVLTLEELSIEEEAIDAVEKAESTILPEDIDKASDLVSKLPEGTLKDELIERIENIGGTVVTIPSASDNLDILINVENKIELSMDTNIIRFDNFDGTKDEEKLGAVNLSITSTLPYEINAYLASEIQSINSANIMDKRVLNIKEGLTSIYKQFNNIDEKVSLSTGNPKGKNVPHEIDILLKGGYAYKKDNYKAVIKIEVVQS